MYNILTQYPRHTDVHWKNHVKVGWILVPRLVTKAHFAVFAVLAITNSYTHAKDVQPRRG